MRPAPLLLALAAGAALALPPLSDTDAFHLLVVNEHCWGPYFESLDWLSLGAWASPSSPLRACVANSVQKALGYGIVAGGAAVNALQVHKLYSQGSAEGMSLGSQYQSMWSNILGAVYMALNGAALDKYGETILQALGPAVITGLMWRWAPPSPLHAAAVLALTAAAAALALCQPGQLAAALNTATLGSSSGAAAFFFTPQTALLVIYFLSQLSFWASRLGQIYATHCAGQDVSQSIVALAANGLGSTFRVFSSQAVPGIPEGIKPVILAVSVFNTALNWTLVGQWLYYNVAGGGKVGAKVGGKGKAISPSPSSFPSPAAVPQPPRRSAAIAADKAIEKSATPAKRRKNAKK
jgi:hypothetical protein